MKDVLLLLIILPSGATAEGQTSLRRSPSVCNCPSIATGRKSFWMKGRSVVVYLKNEKRIQTIKFLLPWITNKQTRNLNLALAAFWYDIIWSIYHKCGISAKNIKTSKSNEKTIRQIQNGRHSKDNWPGLFKDNFQRHLKNKAVQKN